MPELAGQTIDILEVFTRNDRDHLELVEARGTRGHFDQDGRLDTLERSANVVSDLIQAARSRSQPVVDLQPRIRQRRRLIEDLWNPDESLKQEVQLELAHGRASKLPVFPKG